MRKCGKCKLTGTQGQFVKSHILPRAVTLPSRSGRPWIEGGNGNRPKWVYSSWYDPKLCTATGEHILRDYDTWGIRELRRLKLIWSSWTSDTIVTSADWHPFNLSSDVGHGIRDLTCSDPAKFRLFFLSLLWRAAASDLPACANVQMDENELALLTAMVRDGEPEPLSFYPTSLAQLAQRGPNHNLAPLAEDLIQDLGNGQKQRRYLFRLYFDGLIIMMHRPRGAEPIPDHGRLVVGASRKLGVQTIPTVSSLQMKSMANFLQEATTEWPETMSKLNRGHGL